MSDVGIKGPAQADAPLTYKLADSAEFTPRTIKAVFDGASATSAFYPCLVLTDAGGLEVARIPTSSTVAAGGSAEVTWFPRLRAATSGPKFTTASTPPSSPSDGDYWIYPVNESKGYYWMFQYDSAQATYPWLFVGGTPNTDGASPNVALNTLNAVGSTGYYYYNTAFTVPFDGDYMLGGGYVLNSGGGGDVACGTRLFHNTALASGSHGYGALVTNLSNESITRSMQWILGLTAGDTVGICATAPSPGTQLAVYTDAQFVATRVSG